MSNKEQRRLKQMIDAQMEIKMLEAREAEAKRKVEEMKRIAAEKGGDDYWANHHLREAELELQSIEIDIVQARQDIKSANVLPEEIDEVFKKLPII
jgi:hypothetical protein